MILNRLNVRYVAANWDLDEVAKLAPIILEDDALIARLQVAEPPVKAKL
jgi:hypothetical protein